MGVSNYNVCIKLLGNKSVEGVIANVISSPSGAAEHPEGNRGRSGEIASDLCDVAGKVRSGEQTGKVGR
jgi:hypothetical protein